MVLGRSKSEIKSPSTDGMKPVPSLDYCCCYCCCSNTTSSFYFLQIRFGILSSGLSHLPYPIFNLK